MSATGAARLSAARCRPGRRTSSSPPRRWPIAAIPSRGRPAASCWPSRVSRADGGGHVAAITAANDFGVYDLRYADKGSNLRSKGLDGDTPVGPRLIDARAVDLAALRLRTWVNGELAQDARPAQDMLFGFGDIVA